MKKDKAWLKKRLLGELMEFNDNPNMMTSYETGIADGIVTAINLTEKLDEPEVEVEENFYTFDNAKKWLQDNGFVVFEKDKLDAEVQRMIDETYKEMNEKPVIPQFVVDYYNDYKNYELTFEEWFECPEFGKGGKTENKMFEWLLDNSHEVNIERQFIFADIIAHGLDNYKVEKEPVYFAKIKGHELVETETILDEDTGDDISDFCRNVYFVLQKDGQIIVDMKDSGLSGAKHVMTMNQWNNLGINKNNADFEEFTAPHG